MQRQLRYSLFAVLVLVPGLALAQSRPANPGQTLGQAKSGLELPDTEKAFLGQMHQSNGVEIEVSKLALSKVKTPAVRQFAEMLINDHQKADAALMQLARQNGVAIVKPGKLQGQAAAMKDETRTRMRLLEELEGIAFEQSFLTTMVERHDHNLLKLNDAQQKWSGSKFASMYQSLTPTLSKHRQEAYQLLGQVASPQQLQGIGGSGEPAKPSMPASPQMPREPQQGGN